MPNEEQETNYFTKENAFYVLSILQKTGIISKKKATRIKRAWDIANGDSLKFSDVKILFDLAKEDIGKIYQYLPQSFKDVYNHPDWEKGRQFFNEEKSKLDDIWNDAYENNPITKVLRSYNDYQNFKTRRIDIPNENPSEVEVQADGSVSNLPSSTQVMSNGKKEKVEDPAKTLENSETPVDDIPLHLSRRNPFRKTEQAILGYTSYTPLQTCSATEAVGRCYRLNSIYDCESITTHTPNPATTTSDTADATVQTPMWRNYYMNFYRFWHVVGCRWKVTIEPSHTVNVENGQYTAYLYFHGLEHPPTKTVSGVQINHQYRIQHPGVQWKHFYPGEATQSTIGGNPAPPDTFQYINTTVTQNSKRNVCTFSGFWKPGMIHHEVGEDEHIQTWHKEIEVPPTPELLTVLIQPGPRNEAPASSLTFRIYIELEYYTQFKDLKTIYQWVMPDSDIPGITDFAAQSL